MGSSITVAKLLTGVEPSLASGFVIGHSSSYERMDYRDRTAGQRDYSLVCITIWLLAVLHAPHSKICWEVDLHNHELIFDYKLCINATEVGLTVGGAIEVQRRVIGTFLSFEGRAVLTFPCTRPTAIEEVFRY